MRTPEGGGGGGSSLVRPREAEADAADSVDEAWSRRVVAELAPERAHVDVERLRRAEPVHVPHLVDQPLARHDRARLRHQQREQVELLPRQLERTAVDAGAATRWIEADAADLDRRPLGRR